MLLKCQEPCIKQASVKQAYIAKQDLAYGRCLFNTTLAG